MLEKRLQAPFCEADCWGESGNLEQDREQRIGRLIELYRSGDFEAALIECDHILGEGPNAFVSNIMGVSHSSLGRLDQAIEFFRQALEISPDYADVHNNLGCALNDLGRSDEAVVSFQQAIAINPTPAAYNNLGYSYEKLGRSDLAIECLQEAIQFDPDCAEAYNNLGNLLKFQSRNDGALDCYRRAIAIKPDYAEAYNNLGNLLKAEGQQEEALRCLERALEIKPDYPTARAQQLSLLSQLCDWDPIGAAADLIPNLGTEGQAVPPFMMLRFEDDPARHRIRSERFAAERYPRSAWLLPPRPAARPERLHIGYFSADFHNHATMYLMAKLFEEHDKSRFRISAYSYGPDNRDDEMRRRLLSAVDSFHDVRLSSDEEIARLARAEGLDIAIDLKGYTDNTKSGLFAFRAAPIQMNYLGYPGSMGAAFMDYIIADVVVIPEHYRQFYTEKVVLMPGSYQANDSDRKISDRIFTPEEVGLPPTGFVFCCFNNNYKITPAEFDIWMRLLGAVEDSVLWLFKVADEAETNLRREAQKRGVDPNRLVFAEPLPLAEHLARVRLADLFLDTFNYNAHTTASDALWAGVPVVTKLGQSFSARVGGSLLNAVGLPELITETPEEYERLALALATNPTKLSAIKARLKKNRLKAPLFDSERFTRHIEDAYEQAYRSYLDGKEPDHIVVGEGS